jgi:hypothetical protein
VIFYVGRHGRTCSGHPRLSSGALKTWMPATSAGMTNSFPHPEAATKRPSKDEAEAPEQHPSRLAFGERIRMRTKFVAWMKRGEIWGNVTGVAERSEAHADSGEIQQRCVGTALRAFPPYATLAAGYSPLGNDSKKLMSPWRLFLSATTRWISCSRVLSAPGWLAGEVTGRSKSPNGAVLRERMSGR